MLCASRCVDAGEAELRKLRGERLEVGGQRLEVGKEEVLVNAWHVSLDRSKF